MLLSTFHLLVFCLASSVSGLVLPAVQPNVDIPCTFRGANIPLRLNGGTVLLNVQGELTLREVIKDTKKIGLKLIKFNGSATDPMLGNVKFEQVLDKTPSTGSIPVTDILAGGPYLSFYANLKVTSQHSLASPSGFTLYTLQEAKFVAPQVNALPPISQYFQLESPISLGSLGADPATSTQGFPSFSIVVNAIL
ncbi:hypothetical protein K7432_011822 [Basidiobolus ranarum]|uniref:Uncharacterized protein n=1 Tax=Basidiobolus ranarum TaxID=34480 RepID=A0ABR2WLT9_9FUNG